MVLSQDADGRGVVEVDLDGDGQADVSYTDTDADGLGDANTGQLQLEEDLAVEADLFAAVPPPPPVVDSPIIQQELIRIPEHYSLSELAAAHGITTEELLAANPHITDPNLIQADAELVLPEGVAPAYVPPITIPDAAEPGVGGVDATGQPLSEFQAGVSLADSELAVAAEVYAAEATGRVAEIDAQVAELEARQSELEQRAIDGDPLVDPGEILDLVDQRGELAAERQQIQNTLESHELALANSELAGRNNAILEGIVAEREQLVRDFTTLRDHALTLDPLERSHLLPELARLQNEIDLAAELGEQRYEEQLFADMHPEMVDQAFDAMVGPDAAVISQDLASFGRASLRHLDHKIVQAEDADLSALSDEERALQEIELSQLRKQRELTNYILQTPGQNLAEISRISSGEYHIIDNSVDALDYYTNSANIEGYNQSRPVIMGAESRASYLENPRIQEAIKNLREGVSPQPHAGEIPGVDFAGDAFPNPLVQIPIPDDRYPHMWHVGDTQPIYQVYEDPGNPDVLKLMIVSDPNDGFMDPHLLPSSDDDGLGTGSEVFFEEPPVGLLGDLAGSQYPEIADYIGQEGNPYRYAPIIQVVEIPKPDDWPSNLNDGFPDGPADVPAPGDQTDALPQSEDFLAAASLADSEFEVAVETYSAEAIDRVAEIEALVAELETQQSELELRAINGDQLVNPNEPLDLARESAQLVAERQQLLRSLESPELALRGGEPSLGLDSETLAGVVAEREPLVRDLNSLLEHSQTLHPIDRRELLPELLQRREEIDQVLERGIEEQRAKDAASLVNTASGNAPGGNAARSSFPTNILADEVQRLAENGEGPTEVVTVETGGPTTEGQLEKKRGKVRAFSAGLIDTDIDLDSDRVSSFPGEDGQTIVAQHTDATFGLTGATGSTRIGPIGVGGTAGVIHGTEIDIDRVETLPENVGPNGELPSVEDPTNLSEGTTATSINLTQPKDDLGTFGVGEAGYGIGKRKFGPVEATLGANLEASADETPFEGTIESVTNDAGPLTTVTTGTIENGLIVELAGQVQAEGGIAASATPLGGDNDSILGSKSKGDNGPIHGSGSVFANGGVVRETSTGDVSSITTTHDDRDGAAITNQVRDGNLNVAPGGTVTASEGDFVFTQTQLEGGAGGKAGVNVGSEKGPGTSSKLTFEAANADREEISNFEQQHLILPTGADGTSATIPDDAVVTGQTQGTAIRNDNEFTVRSEQHSLPGDPEIYSSDGGDGLSQNSVSTKQGSVSGTNSELAQLALRTLENNPDLEGNGFLEAIANGSTVAEAAVDNSNTPFTGQVTEGSEALVAEQRLQQLQAEQEFEK